MNLVHRFNDFQPFETYQSQAYLWRHLSKHQIGAFNNMLFPITFGVYLSLLALVAWEDLGGRWSDYRLKA